MNDPGRLGGDDRLTWWLNRLRELILSCRLGVGRGYKLRIGADGTILELEPGGAGGAPTTSSGMNYRGDYTAGTYARGDVVRQRSGNSQGIWISVVDNNTSAPTFPEPATVKWEMFAFGVQATSVCQGGSKTVFVNGTPPQ